MRAQNKRLDECKKYSSLKNADFSTLHMDFKPFFFSLPDPRGAGLHLAF